MTKIQLDHRRYERIKLTPEYKRRNAAGTKRWRKTHKDDARERHRRRDERIKREVLAHYGVAGQMQCCWPECEVTDPDMLSLDHVANDGAADRKSKTRGGGGTTTYRRVRSQGFPVGFQTLCHNHQWKKELMRRRASRTETGHVDENVSSVQNGAKESTSS